jgi:hypothetical protein
MCKDKTNSLQLVIRGFERNMIQVPLFGKYKARLSAIWYENNNLVHTVVQLQSPQMQLQYPSGSVGFPVGVDLISSRYPVFITTAAHQIGGLNGVIAWECDLQGTIEVQMVSLVGDPIDNNDICVLNIEMTPIHE